MELSGASWLLGLLIPLIGCLAIGTTAQAQTNQAVYTDALVSGWQNWSWATVNLSNTSPVQSGSDSISVNASDYGGLYFHHDPFDSSLYTSLVFWINGGPSGGQVLQVQAELSGPGEQVSNPQTAVTLPALAANTWQQVTIPLASLGVQDEPNLDGFWIANTRVGGTLPVFYVDTISFTATAPPASVNITVDAADALRTVDARLFGINAAVWDSVFDTPDNITNSLLTAMGNQASAFPRRLPRRRVRLGD